MIVNKTPYPLSFEMQISQAIVCRYGEEFRQYKLKPDIDVSGLSCILQIAKPDGTFTENDVEVITEEDECFLILTIPKQATVVKGVARYSICCYGEVETETHLLYSAEGPLWVDDALITEEMIQSVAEVNGNIFPQDFLTVENLVDIVAYVSANLINDNTTAEDTTWSSQKIDDEISQIDISVSETATGNPIEITDAAASPLVKCVTQITGYQSGTGTPSPDNIRPIVAYTEGEIEVRDGDGNTTTHTTTYPSAIYRGSEDVVKGTETHDMLKKTFDGTESWTKYDTGQGTLFRYSVSGIKPGLQQTLVPNLLCSHYQTVANSARTNKTISQTQNGTAIDIIDNDYSDTTTFAAAMSGMEIAYELATPTTSSVTPTNLPIRTLSGYNHIESSTGELEIEYLTQTYEPIAELIDRSSLHVYSTEEKVVGKWIDGKDLYEITFDLTSPASVNTNATIESLASLSFDKIISLDGLIYAAGVNQYVPIFWSYNTAIMGAVYVDGTNLKQILTTSAYCNCREWITLRYTKQ